MAPAQFRPVLFVCVLSIVNDEVRALQEFDVPLVTRMMERWPRRIPERLMVRHVRHSGSIC